MSADYVKVYSGFFKGSLTDSPPFARLLFLAMLSEADHLGIALGTSRYWAALVGITESEVLQGLEILNSPDPHSTSPDEEGRRIVPYGEGKNRWRIVNYRKYYEKSRDEDRAEYKRQWDRENRKKEPNPTQSDKSDKSDRNNDRKGKEKSICSSVEFEDFCLAYPKRKGDNGKAKAQQIFARLVQGGEDPEKIVAAAAMYARAEAANIGTSYIKQMPTWLNQRCWENDYEVPKEPDSYSGYRDTTGGARATG